MHVRVTVIYLSYNTLNSSSITLLYGVLITQLISCHMNETISWHDYNSESYKYFLINHMQTVHIGYSVSSATTVFSGVAQGSVLGPVLFLVFVNDICSVAANHTVSIKMFADDSKMYFAVA